MAERTVLVRVWDAPVRLFHWAVAILLGTSWLTESRGWMELHFLSGYCLIALLLFRVAWGVVGSQTARFSHFLSSPLSAFRHLSRIHRREVDTEIGHNAAGGWMVLLMLAMLIVQVATGLCANDDGDTEGPLFDYVGKDWSDWLSHIHAVNFFYLKFLVGLHIVAILMYAALKRQNLLLPMITGRKRLPEAMPPPRMASPKLAAALLVAIGGIVALLAWLAPQPY